MIVLHPERVREALVIEGRARALSDPDGLIIAARDLCEAGRPDRALETLERARSSRGDSPAWQLEHVHILAFLGRAEEALEAVHRYLNGDPEAPATLRLVMCFAAVVDQYNVRALLYEATAEDDPAAVLHRLPLAAVGRIPLAKLIAAGGSQKLRLLSAAIWLKALYYTLSAVAGLIFALARLWAGGRDVRIASLGNFSRLADIVDCIDPVLRRLANQSAGGRKPLLFVLYYGGYPNQTMLELYGEQCRMISLTGRLSKLLGKAGFHAIKRVGRHTELTTDYRKIKRNFLENPPVLHIPDAVARNAERKLARLGVDTNKLMICFGLRDMAYYKFYGMVANAAPSAGSREDTRHRCPPLGAYIETARHWAERGYQVLRMGLRVSEPLPDDCHPLVTDYANGERSDELDAYLLAHCHFLLAGDTGLFSGAAAFDRPCVVSDLFLVRNTIYSSNKKTPNIFIPKLVLDQQEGRLLSFGEWVYFNQQFSFSSDCERARFKLIHNDAEDLIDATSELEARIAGRHEETQEDIHMQQRFHAIYSPYQVGHGSSGLISSRFLRKHSNLLG